MKRKFKILIGIVLLTPLVFVILFLCFYGYWNSASPQKTCMSCHEINQAATLWANSAHRDIQCKECHGTALSNGIHSLKEKFSMVTEHLKKTNNEEIAMTEAQIRETMERCKHCHQNEYANWNSSGHSAKYANIFLNKKHNTTERLNFDCLRCHGMYFNGTIENLVSPIDKIGSWALKDTALANQPTIPCMACHQIHSKEFPEKSPDYSNPSAIKENRFELSKVAGFYNRPDKHFFLADLLPKPKIFDGKHPITVSDDNRQRVCTQCHAPNSWHQSGSGDDRTPAGVHMGLSCLLCHAQHSNKTTKSCATCHPAVSSCGIPVENMNTTFKDSKSKHNIHFVKCADCHNGIEAKIISNHKLL
jgi:hypothetical protein